MRRGRRGPTRPKSDASVDDLIQEIRKSRMAPGNYRERSLKIHGLVCWWVPFPLLACCWRRGRRCAADGAAGFARSFSD